MTFRVEGRKRRSGETAALDGSVVFTSLLLLDISASVLWVAKFKTSMDPSPIMNGNGPTTTTKLEKGINVL